MTDLHEIALVLDLSQTDRAQLQTTIDTVSDATDHPSDGCLEACYRLACAGVDTEAIMTVLPSLALYADRHDLEVAYVAEMTSRVCHGFGREPDEMGAVWAAIDQAATARPLLARDILQTLERVVPYAAHNEYSIDACLELIGEESRVGIDPVANRVEERILEDSMDGYER